MYAKSADININFVWGGVMFVFGVVMFVFGKRSDKQLAPRQLKARRVHSAAGGHQDTKHSRPPATLIPE